MRAEEYIYAPKAGRIASIATSTTAASTNLSTLPDISTFLGRELVVQADTGSIWVSFSDAAVTIDDAVNSSGSAVSTIPVLLAAGAMVRMRMTDVGGFFINYKAVTGTPKLRIFPSARQ